jgi:hypothetical protein
LGTIEASPKVFSVDTISDAIFSEHYKKSVKVNELSTHRFVVSNGGNLLNPLLARDCCGHHAIPFCYFNTFRVIGLKRQS